jgi:DNA-binding HxlR family transcriptional regulator
VDDLLRNLKERVQPGDRETVRSIIERIGDKWSVMVLVTISKEPRRFTDLVDIVPGISRRMLTVTLRQLERDGLITRVVQAEVPPRVEYTITALGLTARGPLAAMLAWALDHRDEILTNRENYDKLV